MRLSNMDEDRLSSELNSSPMHSAMIQLHEMFLLLQEAGFNKRQAFSMVKALFVSSVLENNQETND